MPPGLFDEKVPFPSMTPLDSFIPIIAVKTIDKGPLIIVDGCKRFKKMFENNQAKCVCGVIDGVLDEKSMGLLRIFLNQKRPRSLRESVCFYKWLKNNCAGKDFEETLELLGFNAALRWELEPLLSCGDKVLDAVNEGRLAGRLAPDFCLLDARDQALFLDIFRGIELSLQTQREFLEWLPEIAYLKKISVSELLQSTEMKRIINDEILNNPQKIEAIRSLLHSWKFPLYDEALKNWKKLAQATSKSVLENEPSSKVVFVPSPAFEINKLEIRITLNHTAAAKEVFRKLSDVPQTTWSQLIYPINNFPI